MDLRIPKQMVNVKELKYKKEQLKTDIETTEAMFKEQIKEDLQHYSNFVTEYYNMERNIDYSEMIFNSAIEIIKSIQQHNLEQVKMCVAQIFSTENVILNFDDLIKVDYVTKTLLDKIKRNRTQQQAQLSCIRDNELYVCVNVVNSYIRFMTQDDILSDIHIVCPRKITDEEAKYFANDFTLSIDIDKIDHYCLVKKLEVIYDYISSNKFPMEDLVVLNSFLTHKERGDICVLKKGCLKSAESLQYSRKFVMKLNLLVFENYECKKMRGLLLSYFYAISPGLIGVYCKQDYVDSVDMYYLEWIEH